MAGRSRTHSDEWWAINASPVVVRCVAHYKSTGGQCCRVAEDGSVVCDQHGGAAAQVRRRAAERIAVTADDAAKKLASWMDDSSVPFQVRAKIAQDLLDRAGLAAAQVHKIMPVTEDPVEALFKSILDDPNGLMDRASEPAALEASKPVPAQDALDRLEESWVPDAEIVEDDADERVVVPPPKRNPTTPPRHIREGLGLGLGLI